MRYNKLILSTIFALLLSVAAVAQDTVDAIRYNINLDLGHRNANAFCGHTDVYLTTTQPDVLQVQLDLQGVTVDSVMIDGTRTTDYTYAGRFLTFPTPTAAMQGDTFCVTVYYHGGEMVESYGFGGIHFENNLIYNLGAAITAYPHPYGRAWFPCRDNFSDKAIYDLHITVRPNRVTYCNGTLQSTTTNADGSTTYHWHEPNPLPTYLVSVAAGDFNTITYSQQGDGRQYPATLAFFDQDTNDVKQAFEILNYVLPKYEQCFGQYDWHRIGYVATPMGSMEHTGNIALINRYMTGTDEAAQSVIIHELSHSWFGNLITCATSYDMWFNEGGASFCEELGFEAAKGREYSNTYYRDLLSEMLRTLHHTDGDYLPLYGLPSEKTYSTTVYKKGALVFHTLRGYLGEQLFYSSMRRLFESNKFAAMDTYAIRDSLSAYSGTDLTDFFDFHIFGKGFLNYNIDSMHTDGTTATVFVRQRLVGTQTFADGNRVPITFFSAGMDTATRTIAFDGQYGNQTVDLPFEAAFAIVDYTDQLSDAVCRQSLTINNTQRHTLKHVYAGAVANSVGEEAWINIEHHWVGPDTAYAQHPAIVRMSPNRYWKITGKIPATTNIKGKFFYALHNHTSQYAFLDKDLYSRSQSTDSLILLYRPTATAQWLPISATREGNSKEGYLTTDNLQQGEYALAIGRKELVGIADDDSESTKISVYPNPCNKSFTISMPNTDDSVTLVGKDMNGKEVMRKTNIRNGNTIPTNLPAGTYILYIEKNGKTIFADKIVVE